MILPQVLLLSAARSDLARDAARTSASPSPILP
jgi:hypothetical protein